MLKINQIYNMDCLLGIQKMLEHRIQADLIVTDPPYFIKSTNFGIVPRESHEWNILCDTPAMSHNLFSVQPFSSRQTLILPYSSFEFSIVFHLCI